MHLMAGEASGMVSAPVSDTFLDFVGLSIALVLSIPSI